MKKNPLFAIILVVLSLGCSASDSPVGPGLMVKEFKFTPNYLNGDQKTALTLVVQNKGSKNIEGAYATVYGFGKESDMWEITSGDLTTQMFNLRAPSSFTNNVGEEKRFVWLMKNDDMIPKDAVRPYTANARVCYPYETSVLARAEIISENEWMSNPPTQHQIDVTQTTGPVRITILSKQPVIMSSKVSLDLLVENVGSGTVARKGYCNSVYGTTSSAGKEDLNYIDIDIKGISDNCVIEDGDELFLEQGRRQKITVSCEVSGIDAPITTADISITLNYDYYLDAKASVRVKGPVNVDGVGEEPEPDEPDEPEEPIISSEITACFLSFVEYDENNAVVEVSCSPEDPCVVECSVSGKVGIGVKEEEMDEYTYLVIEGKTLNYGGNYDLADGNNYIAVLSCGEKKTEVYLNVAESGTTCASGYSYTMTASVL